MVPDGILLPGGIFDDGIFVVRLTPGELSVFSLVSVVAICEVTVADAVDEGTDGAEGIDGTCVARD